MTRIDLLLTDCRAATMVPGGEAYGAVEDAVIAVARRIMERAAEPALQISVPLVVDARAAPNWDDAH